MISAVFKDTAGNILYNLYSNMEYGHKITSKIGYDIATMKVAKIKQTPLFLLNKIVHTYVRGAKVWEGYVESIEINRNGYSITYSIADMYNSIQAQYTDSTTNENKILGAISSSLHVDQYGTLQTVINAGTASAYQASRAQAAYLLNHQNVKIVQGGFSTERSVTINCRGLFHKLNKVIYTNDLDSIQTVSGKIKDVLDSYTDLVFNTSVLTVNSVTVPTLEDQYRTAATIVNELIDIAGPDDERYYFGVYENQNIEYGILNEEVSYEKIPTANGFKVRNGNRYINPWHVRPDKIARIASFNGQAYEYITSVSYTAPYDLQIEGAETDSIAGLLANLRGY